MSEIKPIETWFDGYHFRSRTEARWAVFFKTAGIRYEYEKEGYALPAGWYLPDFFLPDLGRWFEVKGTYPSVQEVMLILQLHEATGFPSMLAIGAPKPEDQIIYPDSHEPPSKDMSDIVFERYYFCDDRRNRGEFWLVCDEVGMWVPVNKTNAPDHDRAPGVFSATAAGYAAARAERFERRGR